MMLHFLLLYSDSDTISLIGNASHSTPHDSHTDVHVSLTAYSVQPFDPHCTPNQALINTTTNPSAATSTLVIADVATDNTFDCVISNGCGNITSSTVAITVCAPDINCSGDLSVQDIFDFLSAYFAGTAAGDFNGAGGVTVQDIFDFLNGYFLGCP